MGIIAREVTKAPLAIDYCDRCGQKLAIFAARIESKDGKRIVHKPEVACQVCHYPAPADHPLQKQLDADWQAKLDREQADRNRPRPAQTTPALPYGDHLGDLQNRIAGFQAALDQQAAKIAEQGEQIGELQRKLTEAQNRRR